MAGFWIHEGLIMSCAHVLSGNIQSIRVRKVNMNVWSLATIVHQKEHWDVVILKIHPPPKVQNPQLYKFAGNGSLTEGQILLHMGNSMVGSYYIVRVCFSCVQDVTLPSNDVRTCKTYNPAAYENIATYRKMGDVWNRDFFNLSNRKNHHAKNLNPLIPIIQFSGFTPPVESLGGPLINAQGEIVGMVAGVGDRIAIHVTALKSVLEAYTGGAGA